MYEEFKFFSKIYTWKINLKKDQMIWSRSSYDFLIFYINGTMKEDNYIKIIGKGEIIKMKKIINIRIRFFSLKDNKPFEYLQYIRNFDVKKYI